MVQHANISHASIPGAVVIHDEGTNVGTATAGINFVGTGVSGTVTSGTAVITVSAGGGGSVVFYDEGVVAGTAAILNVVGSSGTIAVSGGTATLTLTASGGTPSHNYFTWQAAQLEPLALEGMTVGTAAYAVGTATKLVVGAFNQKINGGRWDLRELRQPFPFTSGTITGGSANSSLVTLDPALATYTSAWETYHDRLYALGTSAQKYLGVTGANGTALFLPGAYGAIITSAVVHDNTWVVYRGPAGTVNGQGVNLTNEIGDVAGGASGAGDDQRVAIGLFHPISKNTCNQLVGGAGGNPDQAVAAVTFIQCSSSWGAVTDSNTYIVREDCTGTALDTASKWTRTQTAGGTVEIDATWPWIKVAGNNTWGQNGIFTQTTTARAAGKVFQADVIVPHGGTANVIMGWHDGAGQSFSDFVHGLYINSFSGANGTAVLQVFEEGVSRGIVKAGLRSGDTYRFRITLAAGSATYEAQGGTAFAAFGGTAWTGLNAALGTASSSSTTPLAIGVATSAGTAYVNDIKAYT